MRNTLRAMANGHLTNGLARIALNETVVVRNQDEPVQHDPLDQVLIEVGADESLFVSLKDRHLGYLAEKKRPDGIFVYSPDGSAVTIFAVEVKQTLTPSSWNRALAQCRDGLRFARVVTKGMPSASAATHLRWAILYRQKSETDPQWWKLAAGTNNIELPLPDGVASAGGYIRTATRDTPIPLHDLVAGR